MSLGAPRLVILGSGWGGFELLRGVDRTRCDVTMVSPSVTEPIRRAIPGSLSFHQASCESIDFGAKTLFCRTAFETRQEIFSIHYDRLVIAVGAKSNTFGIPGVEDHAFFLKDISDARRIRQRVIECFEHAKQCSDPQVRRHLLHFCIVGGGPTGIEFSAELHDFVSEDLRKLYPDLFELVRITVFDVAKRILSGFDASLAEYAMRKFSRQKIEIVTGMGVTRIQDGGLWLSSGQRIDTGMIVWATGLAPNKLIDALQVVQKDDRTGRLVTDRRLRVLAQHRSSLEDVYAIGDCATIENNDLPSTAQVAKQKAKYLRAVLNAKDNIDGKDQGDFEYKYAGSMAYIGGWKAIADIRLPRHFAKQRGWVAWLFWRSAYFSMAVSWRNKVLIPMYWFLTWAFGRDISQI